IWVGHNNGQLWMTTNGTATTPNWTRVDTNGPLPGRWVAAIVIDRNNANRVYIGNMGYAPDNLWRTIDGGLTWQNISGTGTGALPLASVSRFAQHRLSPARLFAGTDVGLFTSEDDRASWAVAAPRIGAAEVEQLVWRNDAMLMAV